jgi:hypothetical protein
MWAVEKCGFSCLFARIFATYRTKYVVELADGYREPRLMSGGNYPPSMNIASVAISGARMGI